jgi:hypothetical protein
LFGIKEKDYKKPTALEISDSRVYMQGLMQRYQEAMDNLK